MAENKSISDSKNQGEYGKQDNQRRMMGRGNGGGHNRFMREVVKPKDFKGTMKKLWQYFAGEKKSLLLVFGIITFDTIATLMVPFLMGKAIDALSYKRFNVNYNMLAAVVGAMFVAYVLDGILNFSGSFIMAGFSQRIVKILRTNMFAKLQKLPVAFFDTRENGDIMSRLTNDIDNVSMTISQSTSQLIADGLIIAGTFIFMIVLSPILTLASLITVPLVFLLSKTIAKNTKAYFKGQQDELGKLNGHIEEVISGFSVVKAFNHEENVVNEFQDINERLWRVGLKAQIWSGFLMPLMNVISNIGFLAVAAVGGTLAVNGTISIGVIASFLTYSKQFSRPLNDIANIFNTLQSAVASAERVFEVLEENEEIKDSEDAIELKNPKGNVNFKNVSFGYRDDVKVLKNISFSVKAGNSIALVGPTGSGKTTIVNLLSRFYDVTGGEILLDEHNIMKYSRNSLRNCFGIVLQDTYLFQGTIMENIKYGRLDATDEAAMEAAKTANAHGFIKRLSEGYNTMLTESGSNLSQGQRQLIAIARAILADTPILILDEATSNVDTRTELRIQQAMLKLMEGRTSFIIAHRLSTIRDADNIMVIADGEIAEQGNHDELMAQKGNYFKLYSSQFNNTLEG